MILKEDSTEQKLRGAYYTPLKLAEKMVDFFKQDASIKSILEPSCGDGVFVDALVETQFLTQNRKVTAIEIEKNEAKKVAAKLKNNPNVSVVNRDFFEFYQKYIIGVRWKAVSILHIWCMITESLSELVVSAFIRLTIIVSAR